MISASESESVISIPFITWCWEPVLNSFWFYLEENFSEIILLKKIEKAFLIILKNNCFYNQYLEYFYYIIFTVDDATTEMYYYKKMETEIDITK